MLAIDVRRKYVADLYRSCLQHIYYHRTLLPMEEKLVQNGALIVIESSEHTFASNNIKRLAKTLKKLGHKVVVYDFPVNDGQAAHFVKAYESGKYGNLEVLGPYAIALFYALERFDYKQEIQLSLQNGDVVICHNYTASLMAKGGAALSDDTSKRGYFLWVDAIEYQILRLPRPNITLLVQPKSKPDGGYSQEYRILNKLFPKDFNYIETYRRNQAIDSKKLDKIILEKVIPQLPEPQQILGTSPVTDDRKWYTPPALTKEVAKIYDAAIESMYKHYSEVAYLLKSNQNVSNMHYNPELLLPLAFYGKDAVEGNYLKEGELLPESYSSGAVTTSLLEYRPRNEIDILAYHLTQHTDFTFSEVQSYLQTKSFEKKSIELQNTLQNLNDSDLPPTDYLWQVASSYRLIEILRDAQLEHTYSVQYRSPRLGYYLPPLASQELEESITDGYDKGLELYSMLQQAGYYIEAQYATLAGHKCYVIIRITFAEFQKLIKTLLDTEETELHNLATEMLEILHTRHPLLASYLTSKNAGRE